MVTLPAIVLHPFMYLSFVLTETVSVEQEDPLKLHYSHIGCKVLSTYVLFLCVEQDYPLKLPYGHIGYKSSSPLHELCYCVLSNTTH